MRLSYNVFDNEKKVLSNVQAKDVCAITGLPENSNLSYYYKNNALVKGRWRIEVSVDKPEQKKCKPASENIYSKFTVSMLAEWRRMNARYGRR